MTQNVQEIIYKKEKIRKKIDFISEIFVATERDRQRVQEKKIQVPKQQDTPDKIRILSGCK